MSNTLKIALIHHQYARKGGMETYLLDLIQDFGRRGDSVDVFVYKQDLGLNVPLFCQVHHKNLKWLPRKFRQYYFSLSMAKNKLVYDLVISTMRSFNQDISICGGTHPGFLSFTGKKSSFFDNIEIKAEKKAFIRSKYIIAHSNLIRDEIIQYYNISENKILRLFPPVNTNQFNLSHRESREFFQKKYQINPKKCTLLFPSTSHKRKGFYELNEAFKLLSADYELLVAGSKFNELKSPSNVRYLGFVQNMAELYSAVDGVILPSHYEPFGLVVTEALACGTPVIISKFVGAKDVLDECSGIVLPELLPGQIRNCIESFSNREFLIDPDFISKYNLDLSTHVDLLKDCV